MTDSAQATPRPWRVDGEALRAIVRGDDMTIVAVRHRLPAATHEANAAMIVRAVNRDAAFDAMLEALQVARQFLLDELDDTVLVDARFKRVEAAIALAERQS